MKRAAMRGRLGYLLNALSYDPASAAGCWLLAESNGAASVVDAGRVSVCECVRTCLIV